MQPAAMLPPRPRGRLTVLLSALAVHFLLACSPDKPPEVPASPEPSAAPEPSVSPAAPAGPAPMPGAVIKKDDSSGVPEDYSLTASDCMALGQQYGAVGRSDQMAALSPKLTEKQRTATAASIDKVVQKLEDQWIDGCREALVGKVVVHAT